jgi:hypothetical protein
VGKYSSLFTAFSATLTKEYVAENAVKNELYCILSYTLSAQCVAENAVQSSFKIYACTHQFSVVTGSVIASRGLINNTKSLQPRHILDMHAFGKAHLNLRQEFETRNGNS